MSENSFFMMRENIFRLISLLNAEAFVKYAQTEETNEHEPDRSVDPNESAIVLELIERNIFTNLINRQFTIFHLQRWSTHDNYQLSSREPL